MTTPYRTAARRPNATTKPPTRSAINTVLKFYAGAGGRPPPDLQSKSTAKDGTKAADETDQQNEHPKDSTTASSAKRLIVGFAVWGIVPPAFATWLIHRFRLEAV